MRKQKSLDWQLHHFFGLLSFRGLSPDIIHKLVFAFIMVTPGVLYLLGIRWCRFIVGGFAALFMVFWSLSPLMQHAIDRHAGFWNLWAIGEIALIAFTFAAFARPTEIKHQVSP
jgi:hypothetical protein